MRKGDLVQLDVNKTFTKQMGGTLKYPYTNYECDESGVVFGSRKPTSQDADAWRNSEDSKGMNCAGETKLPPTCYSVPIHRDRIYEVLRARCRVHLSYGNPTPGMTQLLCLQTGQTAYIRRELLEVV